MADEKTEEPHYSVVALTDIVKQTYYSKYQRAIGSAKALDEYELRAPRAKINSNLSGRFKTDIIDLLLEIQPKTLNKEGYKDLAKLAEKAFMQPNSVTQKQYKEALLKAGSFLDKIGVTKINDQTRPSGASEVLTRT